MTGRPAALLAAILVFLAASAHSFAADPIRIGLLRFGTVNWEIDTLLTHRLDEKHGVKVEVVPFAGEDASAVAFRAGEVDMIVTDWIEVARLRAQGDDVTFAPYSSSTGAIMVAKDSPLESVSDLKGLTIAVAGGPLDKSWLLIQAMARQEAGLELSAENEIVHGAPPLLAEKLRQGEFDAALNFWHFNARLDAEGFRRLVGAEDAAKALGASGPVSVLGFVFRESWAGDNREAVAGFLAASREAKELLKSSDAEWQRLHEAGTIREDGAALAALREGYRRGIPSRTPAEEEKDAAKLFAVLAEIGGERLVGSAKTLPEGTFWSAAGDD